MSQNQQSAATKPGKAGAGGSCGVKCFSSRSTGGGYGRLNFSSTSLVRSGAHGSYSVRLGGGINKYGANSLFCLGGSKRISIPTSTNTAISTVGKGLSFSGDRFPVCPPGGIQNVTVNEILLQPVKADIDPQFQKVRTEEREQIKSLNNKFACFIDKVRFLEQQNKFLETKWNFLQEQAKKLANLKDNIRPLFEVYVSCLQRQLDTTKNEKCRLEGDLKSMQEVVEDFKAKYEEEINKRACAENEFVSVKKDVDVLYLQKTGLDVKQDNFMDELNFLKNVFDAELAEMRERIANTNVILTMDNNRDLDFEGVIAEAKAQYGEIASKSRAETEAHFVRQIQQLKAKAGQHGDNLRSQRNEIQDLTCMIKRLQGEIECVKKQICALETAITDAEGRGEVAVKDAKYKLCELEAALQKLKEDLAIQLRNYQELLNCKMAMDIEIATYKTLLEGEESRMDGERDNNVTISVYSSAGKVSGSGYSCAPCNVPSNNPIGAVYSTVKPSKPVPACNTGVCNLSSQGAASGIAALVSSYYSKKDY